MKFFAVAALFATAAMAAPGSAPVPGAAAAAGNGNAPVINQTQQKAFTDACSAKGNHPVCCDQIDTSKTTTVNEGLLGGLLGEGLGGVLNNLVGGEPGACSGKFSTSTFTYYQ
ncbi:unnamed protein product [Aspergillus oryzae]|nr:unnamed protein product [Aspergillus oryzae]GMG12324.1 unnamed protein product [Aspergillus oryzae]GMG43268.1 unnamed protein product [Aspergillus oryzae var. brunneus]